MIQRLDQLAGPVEVGRWYLVPTVVGQWNGVVKAWPVIGPQHSDAQHLNFDIQHYHLDARFVARRDDDIDFFRYVMGSPMQTRPERGVNVNGFGPPVWRRRLCRRSANPANAHILGKIEQSGPNGWRCHFAHWEGKQARHDGRGWICPHRSVPSADHADVDGVITCPLHLLRIDAATGIVLPWPHKREAKAS